VTARQNNHTLRTILKETYAAVDAIVGSRSLNDATKVSLSAVVVGIDCCNRRSVGCRPSYWSTMNQVLQNTTTSWCQKRTSGLYGEGEINRGRYTDHPAGRHSIRTNQCPPPPSPHIFTGRMPFLPPNQQRQSNEGNYRIRIREKTLEFSFLSGVTWTVSVPYSNSYK